MYFSIIVAIFYLVFRQLFPETGSHHAMRTIFPLQTVDQGSLGSAATTSSIQIASRMCSWLAGAVT